MTIQSFSEIQAKYATSKDGTRLYAIARGNPRNPSLVCTHGFGCTSFSFSKQFASPRMLDSVYLIAFDLRGNGRSSKPETEEAYAKERYAEDFWAVCEVFGVQNPIALGWSLGGLTIADVLTSPTPSPSHSLKGVVYIGGPVPTRAFHFGFMTPYLAESLGPLLSESADTYTRAFPKFVESCVYEPEKSLKYEDKARWVGEAGMAPHITRIQTEKASRSHDTTGWEDALRKLPMLVVQGKEDLLVDGEKCKRAFTETFGGSFEWLWVDGTGHAPFWEKPEAVESTLIPFVQKVGQGILTK